MSAAKTTEELNVRLAAAIARNAKLDAVAEMIEEQAREILELKAKLAAIAQSVGSFRIKDHDHPL